MQDLLAPADGRNQLSAGMLDRPTQDYLPSLVRDVCTAVHFAHQLPIEICLGCAIGALAMSSQRRYRLRVTPNFVVPLVMHVGAFATTGERKSVALDKILSGIVEVADSAQYGDRFTLFSNASGSAIMDGLVNGSAAWVAEEAHYVYDQITKEEEAILTQAWDGRKIRYHRKRTARVVDAAMSVLYLAQPEIFAPYAAMRNGELRWSGVLPRQAMFVGTSMVGQRLSWKYGGCEHEIQRFHRFTARQLRQSIRDADLPPVELQLTPGAASIWAEYHDWVETNSAPGYAFADVTDFAARSADMCARISGNFHLCDSTDKWVTETSARQGRRLAERLLRQAQQMFGDQGTMSRAHIQATKLYKWLTRRFGHQGWCWKNHALRDGPVRPLSDFEGALAIVVSLGQVEIRSSSGGAVLTFEKALP